MKTRQVPVVLLLLAGISLLIAWLIGGRAPASTDTATSLEAQEGRLGPARQPRPGARAAAAPNPLAESIPGTWVPKLLVDHNDWKDAYAKLDGLTSVGPAERLFYKALILDVCSLYPKAVQGEDPELIAAIRDGRVEEYGARLTASMKDPLHKAAVVYNLRRKIAYACKDFSPMPISQADIARAYSEAADAGDLKAQARLLHFRQAETAMAHLEKKDVIPSGFSDPLTPVERDLLVATLFTGDPIAIRVASQALSLGTPGQSLRFGPDHVDLGEHAEEIWTLVACQFGLECGARNMTVTNECARLGQCADDFAGYLSRYAMSPAEFAFAWRTSQAIAEAIRTRNDAAFQLVAKPGGLITSLGSFPPPVAIR